MALVVFPPRLCLFVCCFQCIKKTCSLLFQCVSQSVCLSLSMWSSAWLFGLEVERGVTPVGHPIWWTLRGEHLPLERSSPSGPNGSRLVLLSVCLVFLPLTLSISFCLSVSLPTFPFSLSVLNLLLPLYFLVKMRSMRLENIPSLPSVLCFVSCLTKAPPPPAHTTVHTSGPFPLHGIMHVDS